MWKVYRREGSPFWWYKVRVPGRSIIRASARTTERAKAVKLAKAVEAEEWKRRTAGDPSTLTFARAAVIYASAGKETRFTDALVRHFRDRRVSEITSNDIQMAARMIYPDASPATWNRQAVIPARAIINYCAGDELCSPIKVKLFREEKPVRKAVGADWHDQLRKHASPQLAALMGFLRVTAARIGQALALEPEAFDLPHGTVTIPAAKRHPERTAYLTPQIIADLANIMPKRGPMFGYRRKEPVYRDLKAACKAAGIEYLGTHQPGRHTFATEMLVRHRVDVATTGKLGGWKSHRLLTETYAHPEGARAVVNEVFGTLAAQSVKSGQRKSTIRHKKSMA